jgi:hypothetical protein
MIPFGGVGCPSNGRETPIHYTVLAEGTCICAWWPLQIRSPYTHTIFYKSNEWKFGVHRHRCSLLKNKIKNHFSEFRKIRQKICLYRQYVFHKHPKYQLEIMGILGYIQNGIVSWYVIIGIAAPAMERYTLGPLMYHVVCHRLARNMTKLLRHKNIDEMEWVKRTCQETRIT